MAMYRCLLRALGPRHWWPAETPFEVMVGAILTQNTAWANVSKAIDNLRGADMLDAHRLAAGSVARLARLIRPSGYFNQKARRLSAFAEWFCDRYAGDVRRMRRRRAHTLRRELLDLNGIGEETADSMLLYALGKPVFVVDAYTRRILSRHGVVGAKAKYCEIQEFFESRLPRDTDLYNEFHALIVALGNSACRKTPRCEECPLRAFFERRNLHVRGA